jgi:ankyrin repeat protein
MESNINKLLKKYYKTFLLGKNSFNTDKDKSYEYIKESLKLLDEIKKNNSTEIDKYSNILNETEKESNQILNKCVDYYLESDVNNNEINYKKLFKSVQKGNIDEIKKYNMNEINFKKLFNNQTLLHYAVKFGDTTFLRQSLKLGAHIDTPNGEGNSLLEYACLEGDPNMINFLLNNGANMKKHLFFRTGQTKNLNYNDSIDIANLCKIIIEFKNNNLVKDDKISLTLNKIRTRLDLTELIGFNDKTLNDLINNIEYLLNTLDKNSSYTYLKIIDEELEYNLHNKLGCPTNKIDIILINLIPFINYPFNLSIDWLITLELKYIILKNINIKIIDEIEIKKNIVDELWDKYIKTEILQEDYLGIIISQLITKIKV